MFSKLQEHSRLCKRVLDFKLALNRFDTYFALHVIPIFLSKCDCFGAFMKFFFYIWGLGGSPSLYLQEFVSNALIWSQAIAVQLIAPALKFLADFFFIVLIFIYLFIFDYGIFKDMVPIVFLSVLLLPLILFMRKKIARGTSFAVLQQNIMDNLI